MQLTAAPTLGDSLLAEFGGERLAPDRPAGRAWSVFLRAHASLIRQLDRELERDAAMPLADFDVLMQLALADPDRLRMAELAERALVSRSGMTRRVERLAAAGLVTRSVHSADRRSVIVSLTDAGIERLREALPIHVRGVEQHFADRLGDTELVRLEEVLSKVVVNCDFG